jgi:hypothetical protein
MTTKQLRVKSIEIGGVESEICSQSVEPAFSPTYRKKKRCNAQWVLGRKIQRALLRLRAGSATYIEEHGYWRKHY